MRLLGSCFGACFGGPGSGFSGALQEGSCGGQQRASAAGGGWQTVPDDVLQAVLEYLSPGEVAVARLTCRHWRLTLSCYTPHLTLPMKFLSSKGARGVLKRAGQVFPAVRQVTLTHANGWCDPVQARMDVEPLVVLESRLVPLEPLAAALPQLTRLAIADATFTRQPWALSQLAWLGGLRGLRLAWDTGLWAPGQVLQEGEALQPVFGLSQLTELVLAKNAYLFLGEICLGDSALAAAAGLRALAKLDLSTIRVQDDGFASLAVLNHLTHLSLHGQLNVTIGVLAQVFSKTTKLEELSLGCLVPSNRDLKQIAAAHAGSMRSQSSSRRQATEQRRSARRQLAEQLQQQQALTAQLLQQEQPAVPTAAAAAAVQVTSSSNSSSSSTCTAVEGSSKGSREHAGTSQAAAAAAPGEGMLAHHRSSSLSRNSSSSSSSHRSSRSSSTTSSSSSSSRSSSSSSSSVVRFSDDDWSAVLLPLQRLRRLCLQSDLVLLGSCSALRGMACLTHLQLHGAAKFLATAHFADLPASWLSQLAVTSAGAAAAADAGSDSAAAAARVLRGRVPSASSLISAHGAWPALKSLHIDGLQCADDIVEGVRQLASLKTLILTGPCLLSPQHQQQGVQQGLGIGAGAGQLHQQQQQGGGAARLTAAGTSPAGQQQQKQQQQQQHSGEEHNSQQQQQQQEQGREHRMSSSSSSAELQPASSSSDGEACHDQQTQCQQQQQQQASAGLSELRSLSGLSQQPQEFWAPSSSSANKSTAGQQRPTSAAAAAAAGRPASSSATATAAPFAAAAVAGLPEVAAAQHGLSLAQQQQQQQQQVSADLDMLSRLTPLEGLACFQLGLQQHMPRGLVMTPFALVHLAASWSALTSISLDVTAAAAGGDGGGDPLALVAALSSLTSLKDLSLCMADDADATSDISSEGPTPHHAATSSPSPGPAAAAPSSPQHSQQQQQQQQSCWYHLPPSLASLSLQGFCLEPQALQQLAAATPALQHLRLLHCNVSSGLLWVLARAAPRLATLVIKEAAFAGIGTSGVAAIAALTQLRALAVTLEPHVDVRPLAELTGLRYLLLDGRSNTELSGVKALRRLAGLRALVLPLLHLQHADRGLLAGLALALPHTLLANISTNFGSHHGCQWYKAFSLREREWWREPQLPWQWYPTLCISP